MVVEARNISWLFSEVDNLSCFKHPVFDEYYQLMTIQQQIDLAMLMVNQIIESGYAQVMVIETGASPLVKIMREVLNQKNKTIDFFYLKIPRDTNKENLSDFIRNLTPDFLRALTQFISKPFLLLDEYIDSGHTMNLVIAFLKKLNCKEHFKTFAYMNLCNDECLNKLLHYAYANKNTKLSAFRSGVYPFENRLDYAPYFYHYDKEAYKKISLDEFIFHDINHCCEELLRSLLEIIQNNQLVIKIRSLIDHPHVKNFVSEQHLALYGLYCVERCPIHKQFFWLLFDMYGPFWTPLPDTYHFSYYDGFDKIKESMDNILLSDTTFLDLYDKQRKGMAHHAAAIMLKKHQAWFTEIKQNINDGINNVKK